MYFPVMIHVYPFSQTVMIRLQAQGGVASFFSLTGDRPSPCELLKFTR